MRMMGKKKGKINGRGCGMANGAMDHGCTLRVRMSRDLGKGTRLNIRIALLPLPHYPNATVQPHIPPYSLLLESPSIRWRAC